ncbi:purine nucleoside phosphorylase [Sphaerochaeta pleomorpha str. Grapes]|uniref:Probable 6-oxopurine nucleoside phosphorylase n=1 Tax=Sphaerochaeta pleomorpha (strain ATCC BAA-1885 / DSM 22778 / Grapes) TaxID=158190 RepID=G8QUU2_SPHPG|nr:MTAP family purine nucleoside phosphorylase [Sphaerochaeta pleomorpha]AEV28118.1 purine nucleoside phosphorylase [Sphaerochaeta pleomorpha str. Grapes]
MNKAIIGGTGASSLPNSSGPHIIDTVYGSVETYTITIGNEEILFLPRHGSGHTTPPHAINFRANCMALKQMGVTYVYALATSGSLDNEVKEGSIVIIEDFLDFTTNRVKTFFDGSDKKIAHTDMSDPYCNQLRKLFKQKAAQKQIPVADNGVYVCTDGPRFEGKSEIRMYKNLGGTIVGMTGIPEVFLAKELNICYSAIGLISNMACGITQENLAGIDHKTVVQKATKDALDIICDIFADNQLDQNHCQCTEAVLHV